MPQVGELVANERTERKEADLVRQYLTEIGRFGLLGREDEARLGQVIEAGAQGHTTISQRPARRSLPNG